jgi:choline dehydrogenase-like flavoprotein
VGAQKDDAFDVIVVGTGIGGGRVAREVSAGGANVLILEKGSAAPIRGTAAQTVTMALIPGRGLHFTPQLLGLIHGIILGGSSILYYATACDPPYAMFDKYGIDLRAPIAEIKAELPLAPLADALVGPAAQRIMASACALGYAWEKLPKFVYQDKCRANCDKCTMGCPYGAKWTSRMDVAVACAHGAVLQTGATVRRVLHENKRVVGVEFTSKGKLQRAHAPQVIVAAGGIGTPAILRQSGVSGAGSDFFFDPLLFVFGEVDDLDGGKEFPMATGYHAAADGYMMTDLILPRWLYGLFTAQVLRLDRLPAQRRSLSIMVKARDELGGHLTKHGGVRKRLGDVERARLRKGDEQAREILLHAGARHIYKTWYLAVHPGGTAKINDVVNADLETEIKNLYVCDCSVIPEAWGQPPSLALLGLGKRLGKHLSSR